TVNDTDSKLWTFETQVSEGNGSMVGLSLSGGMDNAGVGGMLSMMTGDILIESFSPSSEPYVQDLIRRNLEGYEEAGSVLKATFRRLSGLLNVYQVDGSRFFVLRDTKTGGFI